MENQEKKELILKEFLKALESSGFNIFTLKSVAGSLEITEGELNLLFPNGLDDALKYLFSLHRQELSIAIEKFATSGVTENVRQSVLLSFQLLTPYKKALRKIFKYLILPQNILFTPKLPFEIADTIWKGLGINDNNFSFYSKRIILSGIYSNCFLYFVLSKNGEKLEDILSKQLSVLSKFRRK